MVHKIGQLALAHGLVDSGKGDGVGHNLVENDPSDRGGDNLAVDADTDAGLEVHFVVVVGHENFLLAAEDEVLALRVSPLLGQVVAAHNHILARDGQRLAMGRREDIVGREHQHTSLDLGLDGQGNVDGHLVAVEVGVERPADERVDADGLALHQDGLKGLDA